MKFIGWDIEIAKDIPEGIGWKDVRPLGITCASAVSDDFVESWWGGKSEGKYNPQMSVEEVRQMVNFLELQSSNYKIVTWNGLSFDFDVLAEESESRELCIDMALNHIDMMFQFFCQKGFSVGLDAVAKGCGLHGKTEGMHGDLAPIMWRNGECEKVIEYVIQDSRTTLEVANYIDQKKYLLWITKSGRTKPATLGNLITVNECKDLVLPDQSWMTNPLTKEDYLRWTFEP